MSDMDLDITGPGAELLGVKVVGLRELRNSMRATEKGTQHFLQVRLKEAATQVASAVAGKVPMLSGAAAASVRAVATTERASIVAGGPKAPYFPWLDFGGSTGRWHRPYTAGSGSVRRDWYGKGGMGDGEGRYVYPTVREMHDVITDSVSEAVHDALADAGWEPG